MIFKNFYNSTLINIKVYHMTGI